MCVCLNKESKRESAFNNVYVLFETVQFPMLNRFENLLTAVTNYRSVFVSYNPFCISAVHFFKELVT